MRHVRLLAITGLFSVMLPAVSGSTASAAPEPPPCASDQLMVLASDTQGIAGTGEVVVGIANIGASCRMSGYPEVELFNSKHGAVDRHDFHGSSMAFTEPKSVMVTLGYKGSASIGISWSDEPVTLHGRTTTCPSTVSMTVALVHGVGHLSGLLYISASPCGGGVDVTPIEAGAWPQLRAD